MMALVIKLWRTEILFGHNGLQLVVYTPWRQSRVAVYVNCVIMGRTWMMCDLILPTKTIDDKGDWLGFVQKWPLCSQQCGHFNCTCLVACRLLMFLT